MKKNLFVLAFFLLPLHSLFAQESNSENDTVKLEILDTMPEFPGGEEALLDYLSSNIKYPLDAVKANAQGKVIASFIVEKDGSISNIVLKQTVFPSCDAEAIRVIANMPAWKPGKEHGQVVKVSYILPVTFRLNGNSSVSNKTSTRGSATKPNISNSRRRGF